MIDDRFLVSRDTNHKTHERQFLRDSEDNCGENIQKETDNMLSSSEYKQTKFLEYNFEPDLKIRVYSQCLMPSN